jgi:hypothetical protein
LPKIILGGRVFKFFSNEGQCPSIRGDNSESVKKKIHKKY